MVKRNALLLQYGGSKSGGLIVTDHSDYDYKKIVDEAKLVVDSRNATRGIKSDKIVHC